MRRKIIIAASCLVALGAAAAVAVAQVGITQLTFEAKMTPNKVGTKKKPKAVQIEVKAHWETPGDVERPIVQKFKVRIGKGGKYQGEKFPSCTQEVLARRGPGACPKGSIIGKGTGDAYADTTITHPKITVVNGGKNKIYFFTVLDNPARVQAPVPAILKPMTGKWSYELTAEVPKILQIVAGVPIALRDLKVTVGSTKTPVLASVGPCTGGKTPFSIETFYSTGGSDTFESNVACKS